MSSLGLAHATDVYLVVYVALSMEEATARICVPAVDGSIGVQIGTQELLMMVVCLVLRLGSNEGRSRWKSTASVL